MPRCQRPVCIGNRKVARDEGETLARVPAISRTPDMSRQAISLMIIQRYSSRLNGRSKHEAINLGASQLGKNSKSIHQLQCLNLCFGAPGRSAVSRPPRAHGRPDCRRACICAPPAQLSRKVKAQCGNQAREPVDDITSRKTVKQFKWVGTRPVRPDGVPKVTGLAQYGADLAMPGMLVGRILRSPHAHARIRAIDTAKAGALPGVKAVVTSPDFPEQKFEYVGPERVAQNFWHMTRNIMAREKALYEGHAVAAVAAISRSVAEEAASLIEVDYEVLPHVIDVDEAMKPDAPLLFEDQITRGIEPAPTKPSNVAKRVEFKIGDTDAGFA